MSKPRQILNGPKLIMVQEEDFVSNLFNRSLLTAVNVDDILRLLEAATNYVKMPGTTVSQPLQEAIVSRLLFRKGILQGVAAEITCFREDRDSLWKASVLLLAQVSKSMTVGRKVPDAFSAKIQRRLASSVPPRPLVTVDIPDAIEFFTRLCTDALEAEQVLKCDTPGSILVRNS